MMRIDAATLTKTLRGKWFGRYGPAYCPAYHNTRTPALSLADGDGDGVFDHKDNCIEVANPAQIDADLYSFFDVNQLGKGLPEQSQIGTIPDFHVAHNDHKVAVAFVDRVSFLPCHE